MTDVESESRKPASKSTLKSKRHGRRITKKPSPEVEDRMMRREQMEAQGLCPSCGQQLYRLKPLNNVCCLSRCFTRKPHLIVKNPIDHQMAKKIPLTIPRLVDRGQCLSCLSSLSRTPETSSLGSAGSDDPLRLFPHPLSNLPSMNERTMREALQNDDDDEQEDKGPETSQLNAASTSVSSSIQFTPKAEETFRSPRRLPSTPPSKLSSPLKTPPLSAQMSKTASQRAIEIMKKSPRSVASRPVTHRSKSLSALVEGSATNSEQTILPAVGGAAAAAVTTPPHYPATSPRQIYQRHESTRLLTTGTAIYQGEFNERGQKHGQGELCWSNGDVYRGNFANNVRQGHGTLTFAPPASASPDKNKNSDNDAPAPDHGEYVGEWDNNMMHGQGTRRYHNGDIYTGQYVNGKREGEGRFYYSNGDMYWGQWKSNQMNGPGRYYYASGLRFEGDFVLSKRTGKGKLQKTDGSLEIFQYINDQRVGQGVRWSSDRSKAWRLWMPSAGVRTGAAGNHNVRLERRKISVAEAVSMVYEIETAAARYQEEMAAAIL